MKKIIAIALLICVACVCLVSCGASMEDYQENLTKNEFHMDFLEPDEFETAFPKKWNFNIADYGIVNVLRAHKLYFVEGKPAEEVTVVECGSSDDAEKLAEDIMQSDKKDNEYEYVVEQDGCFVLFGNEKGIESAKN